MRTARARGNCAVRNREGHVVLLLVYAKEKFDTLRPEFLRLLKEKYDV